MRIIPTSKDCLKVKWDDRCETPGWVPGMVNAQPPVTTVGGIESRAHVCILFSKHRFGTALASPPPDCRFPVGRVYNPLLTIAFLLHSLVPQYIFLNKLKISRNVGIAGLEFLKVFQCRGHLCHFLWRRKWNLTVTSPAALADRMREEALACYGEAFFSFWVMQPCWTNLD